MIVFLRNPLVCPGSGTRGVLNFDTPDRFLHRITLKSQDARCGQQAEHQLHSDFLFCYILRFSWDKLRYYGYHLVPHQPETTRHSSIVFVCLTEWRSVLRKFWDLGGIWGNLPKIGAIEGILRGILTPRGKILALRQEEIFRAQQKKTIIRSTSDRQIFSDNEWFCVRIWNFWKQNPPPAL